MFRKLSVITIILIVLTGCTSLESSVSNSNNKNIADGTIAVNDPIDDSEKGNSHGNATDGTLEDVEDESEKLNELIKELTKLKQAQDDLLKEIDELNEKVNTLETSLSKKEEDLRILKMEMDSIYHFNDWQGDYFESKIGEIVRLYGNDELQELMFLVEEFDYDTNQITVKDKHHEVIKYNVSDECKVLVAGQHYTIFQTLDEGKDFLDSVTQDPGNKVILVFKNGIVEQIKMFGHGTWW